MYRSRVNGQTAPVCPLQTDPQGDDPLGHDPPVITMDTLHLQDTEVEEVTG